MSNEVIDYLESKNVEYELQGVEVLIICPYCQQKKLSINTKTGVFQCWHCKALNPNSSYIKGHISQLQKEWGDIASVSLPQSIEVKEKKDSNFTALSNRYHNSIKNNKKALKYLMKRGFDDTNIEEFKLGYVAMKGEEWISIPCYSNNIVKLIKYRKITNNDDEIPKYERETGGKSILFNQDTLNNFEEIIIVEGEIDCMTMLRQGYDNTVGLTVGAGTLSPEWYELLYTKDKITLILDPDDVGQTAAKNIWATRLGVSRTWNVVLPKDTDINDFFMGHSKEDFDELLSNAVQFRVDGVLSLDEALQLMYEKSLTQDTEILELPWQSVNRLLGGGLQKQRLYVLGALPGTGKTTIALQICYHLAIKYNIPSLFWCLEMPETSLAMKIIQLHKDLTVEEINFGDALIHAIDMEGIPLYFGYTNKIKPDVFYRTMVEVRNRFGIGFGVFDNIQLMIRTGKEEDMGNASSMFKAITMNLNIPFLMISQPRKLVSGKETPGDEDFKGTSAIEADADQTIWLHRKKIKDSSNMDYRENKTLFTASKSRYSVGGKTLLNFIGEKSKFEEYQEK